LSNSNSKRRVRVRAIRRDPPDVKKLGKALLTLALTQAQAEADAETEHKRRSEDTEKPRAA
jgi:hypothetical protein